MKKIEEFIDKNLKHYSNLDNSEVETYSEDEIDQDIVDYLKEHYRFDYKDICVYFVGETDEDEDDEDLVGEIWVENMAS
jgi:hypothetical protein